MSSTNNRVLWVDEESSSGRRERAVTIKVVVSISSYRRGQAVREWVNILSVDKVSRASNRINCYVVGNGVVNVEVNVEDVLRIVTSSISRDGSSSDVGGVWE